MHGALRKQGRWLIEKEYECVPRDAVLHIFNDFKDLFDIIERCLPIGSLGPH